MTDQQSTEPPPTAVADPRTGPLMDLVQGLIAGYADLATRYADAVPDLAARQRLTADTEKTISTVRGRYCAIAEGRAV